MFGGSGPTATLYKCLATLSHADSFNPSDPPKTQHVYCLGVPSLYVEETAEFHHCRVIIEPAFNKDRSNGSFVSDDSSGRLSRLEKGCGNMEMFAWLEFAMMLLTTFSYDY